MRRDLDFRLCFFDLRVEEERRAGIHHQAARIAQRLLKRNLLLVEVTRPPPLSLVVTNN